jgi:hypothetical protein
MGKMLLGRVASIYIEQANQELGGLTSVRAHVHEAKSKWSAKLGVASSLYSTLSAAVENSSKEE